MNLLLIFIHQKQGENTYVHYQDDGESFDYKNGIYNLYEFSMKTTEDESIVIKFKAVHSSFPKFYKEFKFRISNVNPTEILVDGRKIQFKIVEEVVEFTTRKVNEILIKL